MNRVEAMEFAKEQQEIFGGRMGEFLKFVEDELSQTNASNTLNALDSVDLISRQAAIRWVKTECNPYGKPALEFESGKKVIEHLEHMPSAPRWIPVTEQTLPKHNSVVVVCGEKGTWDFGTYRGHTSTNIFLWNWKKNTLKEVHWWMYKEDALPMPWKGE